ncbi:universal stress protein [Oxalobacteraceae bacterium]|nr:universal stress protein [Oxalobacteraceae bacterium]
MFKHILLPTDGSATSNAAIRKCLSLAKESGAMITGVHVMAPFHVLSRHTEMIESTRAEYLEESMAQARGYLAEIEQAAREIGVPCKTVVHTSDEPYEVIIQSARELGCDLICMASHGRRGIKALLLGSETQKVLTHSQIPVLVLR